MNDLHKSQLRLARAKRYGRTNNDPEVMEAAHDHAVLKVAHTFRDLAPWFALLTADEKQTVLQELNSEGTDGWV